MKLGRTQVPLTEEEDEPESSHGVRARDHRSQSRAADYAEERSSSHGQRLARRRPMGRLPCPTRWRSAPAPGLPSIAWLARGSAAAAAPATNASAMARTHALASEHHSASGGADA